MKNLYSLYDLARDYFYPPAVCLDDEAAKTIFWHMCESTDSAIGERPSDFTLMGIGTFDEESGELTSKIYRVARGAEYQPKELA